MVEPIRRRVVQEKGWLSQQEFLDGLALCQLLPGATVVHGRLYWAPSAPNERRLGRCRRLYLPRLCGYVGPLRPILQIWGNHLGEGGVQRIQCVGHRPPAPGFVALPGNHQAALVERGHCSPDPGSALGWGQLPSGLPGCGSNEAGFGMEIRSTSRAPFPGETRACPRAWSYRGQMCGTLTTLALLVWGLWQWHQDLGVMSLIFLKIGVVAFGGGYAMIPILQWDMIDQLHWLTSRQFLDGILLGFVTPAPLSSRPLLSAIGSRGWRGRW